MRALFRIYSSYIRIHLALRFQYRFELLIWFLSSIVEPVVFLMVWRTVALQQGGAVGGYAVNDLVVYYILMILVNHATYSWFLLAFDYRIRLGGFSADLMKPFHPIHIDMADNIAFKLVALPALLLRCLPGLFPFPGSRRQVPSQHSCRHLFLPYSFDSTGNGCLLCWPSGPHGSKPSARFTSLPFSSFRAGWPLWISILSLCRA